MRDLIKIVLCSVFLGISIIMPAQDLPALPNDGSVTAGSLSNGISYYLVTNPAMKGFADYSLVRKGTSDTASARNELASLPHFNKAKPYRFLSRKGIGCRPEGYISFSQDATIFRFDDVPVFDQAASDTTLLMLFDLIAAQPYQHAIIISGDITPASILQKMNVFSMMVPSRMPGFSKQKYSWTPSEDTEYSFVPSARPSLCIDFRSPRTPDAQMNTLLPFISELYSLELGEIVRSRLEEELCSRNIYPSSLSTSYKGSASSFGDEHFKVDVEMKEEDLLPVTIAVASSLSDLGSEGVSAAEYRSAKSNVLKKLLKPQDNDVMVQRCISAYLYGSDLASYSTKAQFMTSRKMDLDTEVTLFNNYVTALLKDSDNAHLTWHGNAENYDDWTYQTMFRSTWDAVSMLDKPVYEWKVTAGDSLSLWSSRSKVKIKSVGSEPVSGGEMWTFMNGVKVIYKKLSTTGTFNFSLMVKGGYSSVTALQKGEGAFFSDMMSQCDISGMLWKDYSRMLQANGVDIKCKVSSSDMKVSGSAPSSKLNLVIKALLSIADDRDIDVSEFESWRKMELAGLKPACVDSLLFPGYLYSDVKTPSGLTSQTQKVAGAFFDSQFLRLNDGVLVIAGDLSSEAAQKVLSRYLGGFRVSKASISRPADSYKLNSGSTTYTAEGSPSSITIGMAFQVPFTIENYIASMVSSLVMKRALSGALAEYGFSVSLSDRFTIYPQEMMQIIFTCTPVPETGLPEGISGGEGRTMDALIASRKALESVLSHPAEAAELQNCKALLNSRYAALLSDPENYVDAILMRYSSGKDVLTNYSNRISSVSADKVSEIFRLLSEGRRIEYVVKQQ